MVGGSGKSRTSKSNTKSSLVTKFIIPKRPKVNPNISRGISYFDGLEKFTFSDYSSEVKNYLDNKTKEDEKIFVTPFTNHEYALFSSLEVLASERPRIALVGSSGIDKNGMVNYLAETIINEESNLLEVKSESLNSLLSMVRKNAKDAFRSYMFLPNMINNFDVYSLSYRSIDGQPPQQELIDHEIAEEYMRDIKFELNSLVKIMNKHNSSEENRRKFKVTKDALKDLLNNIYNIRKKSGNETDLKPSGGLNKWLVSMESYFSKNINTIGYSIEDTLKNMHESKEDNLAVDKNIYLWYGQKLIDINTVLTTHRINPTSLDKKISYITDYNKTLFSTFQFDESTVLPHKDILNIGKLFAGMVVIIPYMNDFITAVSDVGSVAHSKSMLLQGLKTGNYILDNEGEKFAIKSKRVIIGFDDVDPFFVLKDGGVEVDETEFRNEIKQIDLHYSIDNTLKIRKNTLAIMDSFIDKFNKKNDTNIGFENDAYNALLQSLVMPSLEVANPKLINSEYAELDKKIQELGLYALTHKIESIDKKTILKKKLEDVPPGFFSNIDSEDRYGWLLNDPEKLIGALNGITVWEDTSCELFKTRSHYYKHKNASKKEYLIDLIDTSNGMGDVSASKGQELSADAFKVMLERYGLGTKYDSFALKTYFKDEWNPDWAGPSASHAVGLSQMSEFTGTPMYQNRIVTGTLDPNQLLAQKIGWPYFKSLSAYRLSQLDPSREWYFLFPASNIHDMTKQLALDPFEIEKHVTLIPVRTFTEAYHLMSCGSTITQYDRKYAHELGIESLESKLKDIKKLDELHKNKIYYSTIPKQTF